MKIAIATLRKELESQQKDLQINELMLKENSNSEEMKQLFRVDIEKNKKAIESLRKAIAKLKTY